MEKEKVYKVIVYTAENVWFCLKPKGKFGRWATKKEIKNLKYEAS